MRALGYGWRLLRAGEWGIQLVILTLLAVAYYGTAHAAPGEYIIRVGQVLIWTALLLAGLYTFNSYSDRFDDRFKKTGRPEVKPRTLLMISLLSVVASIALAVFWNAGAVTVALIGATALAATAYSLRPLRLKERGWWGMVTAALFQRIPSFWMIVVGFSVAWLPAVAITAWLFVVGMLFILEHQLEDLESDRAAGVHTLATTRGVTGARWLLARVQVLFAMVTMGTVIVLFVTSTSPGGAWRGSGIVGGGSLLLAILARIRYASTRRLSAAPLVQGPSIEDKHGSITLETHPQ